MRILQSLSVSALFIFPSWLSAATLQVGPGHTGLFQALQRNRFRRGGRHNINRCRRQLWRRRVYFVQRWAYPDAAFNGRPKIDAMGQNAAGKGIWVIDGNNTTVENIEFTGAVFRWNGAGIRGRSTNPNHP